jgi:hypothetical protein
MRRPIFSEEKKKKPYVRADTVVRVAFTVFRVYEFSLLTHYELSLNTGRDMDKCLVCVALSCPGSTRHVGHWMAYVPAPGDYDDGEFCGMKICRGNRSTRRKPAPAPLCPPQIPLDQTRVWTRSATMGSQWLTAWAMARPLSLPYNGPIPYSRSPVRILNHSFFRN